MLRRLPHHARHAHHVPHAHHGAIWTLAAGHRARYLRAALALVLASCFLYAAPLVVQATIDGALLPAAGDAGGPAARIVGLLGGRDVVASRLWWPALVVLALTGIAGGFTYLRGRWSAQASEAIARDVRDRVYDHLQHLPCTWFDTAQTGDVVQRCTSDVETLRVFLANQLVEIGRAAVMLIIPIPLMLAIDVRMAIASLILIPPVVGWSLIYYPRVRRAFKAVDEAEGRMTTTIQENLTGIRVVRAFNRQVFEAERFADRNEAHRAADLRLYRMLAVFWSVSDLLCFAQKAVVIAAGTWWLVRGELQVGEFYFFLTAVSMYIWPVRMMGRILTDLGKATVAIGRLSEVLDAPIESGPEAPVALPSHLRGDIAFEGVTFSHGASPVLHDVSFRVRAGETMAIIGPSGCGKSTIVNLLLRLYDHDSGGIRVDGIDLGRIDRKAMRSRTAVVMQQPFLFSKTIRENLVMGRPSATEEELVEASETACIHDSIVGFDEGYDTRVGERGVTLSGGQRQRVALARALLQDPAILVLDDALSAVDTETETLILTALARRRGRRTTLVIAHRLSTLAHADHAIVLDQGRIVQAGTHEELFARPGLYRRLWEGQGRSAHRREVAGTGGAP